MPKPKSKSKPKPKSPLRLVFLGTGELAIPSLDGLLEAGHQVEMVVVRPPRRDEEQALPEERVGSLLGAFAEEKGLEVRRPTKPSSEEFRDRLAALEPDLGVVVAYGRRFPLGLLEVPRLGWLKGHFSLLPSYRGQHAIRSAISNGEKSMGASVMEIVDGKDTGPLLGQEEIEFDPDDTFGDIAPRLAALGAEMLVKSVNALAAGKKPKKKKQSDRRAPPKATRFTRRQLQPPWWVDGPAVYNRLRAVSPEPGLYCLIRRERVKILAGRPLEWVKPPYGEDGSFLGVRAGRLAILCGDSTVFGIERIELENGDSMGASEIARHFDLRVGDRIV